MARSPPRTAIVRRILFQIDKDGQGQKDWLACGTDIHACLIASLQHLDQHRSSSELASDLSQLQSTAQNAIKSVHHSKVERKWRRLYTDASILKGIAVLLNGEEKMKRTEVSLNAIQDLDIALIVCGAPGLGRLEMIHQEIACLQSDLSECQHFVQDSASAVDTLVSTMRERPYCLASRSIKDFSSMPSLSDYLTKLHCKPFIVRNFAIDWPALSDDKHMWADGNYLAHAGGPGRVVPVEIGWQYTESDWYQDIVPWQDFLQTIGWLGNSESIVKEVKPKYLAQHNLFRQFPALELDIVTPDLVYSCPPVPTDFPTYIAPRDEDGSETVLVNAWIGPQGTTTPAHFDPYYNAYVQVVGQKLIWVASPDVFAKTDESLLDGNSSTTPIFEQNLSGKTPQEIRIFEKAMSATLGPGDLLVLPPGWFHAMRSLSRLLRLHVVLIDNQEESLEHW